MTTFWKARLGHCIYQTQSGIAVHQNFLYRWLTMNSPALQTLIHRRNPHKIGLNYIPHLIIAVCAQPAASCLLGLGGGGVAHALSGILKSYPLQAIENNHEIIQIGLDYFMLDNLSNLHTAQLDAAQFVLQSQQQYQHLLIDLANQYHFPEACCHQDFFLRCKALLYPGGVLAINLAYFIDQQVIYTYLEQLFHGRTVVLPVRGTANMVILAYNGSVMTTFLDMIKPFTKKLFWDRQWGYIARID